MSAMAVRRPSSRRLPRKLRPQELRWTCPSAWIPAAKRKKQSRSPMPPLIGRDRAIQALEMGLSVDGPGYHVFVSGIGGQDKFEAFRPLLDRIRFSCPLPRDHALVHNFADPIHPHHLVLSAGGGQKLAESMGRWWRALQREIPQLLDGEEHGARRQRLLRHYRNAEQQLFRRLSRRAKATGLDLVEVEDETGVRQDFHLRVGDELVALEDSESLPEDLRPSEAVLHRLELARKSLHEQLGAARRKARALGLRLVREVESLDENLVRELVENTTMAVAEEVDADEELAGWLGDCAGFALNSLHLFSSPGGDGDEDQDSGETESSGRGQLGPEVFEINVVRSANPKGCPVVFEIHPNYANLFGSVERQRLKSGTGFFHLAVRPGSLLAADGGILVLDARDVFREAEVWRALKRTLQHHRLELHALESLSPLGATGVRPEPVPVDLKVILVGSNDLYETLIDSDPEFSQVFKVKAEFDEILPLETKAVARLVRALREGAAEEELLPFAQSGLQALVERAVTEAGRRTRLAVDVPRVLDFAREASYWATDAGKRRVDRAAVEVARLRFREQHALNVEWHQRDVLEGIYHQKTSGKAVATLNALTVISLGPMAFGRVARLSASVAAGEDANINIDREVELAGPIHNKGVLILEAFLRARFASLRALPFKSAITFDQSYGPIDGDSASSTEVYALLSAISRLPLRQDVAVTGAVDMTGNILAVGGLNEKVLGFFELCNARRLTGSQGVMLPSSNVEDLMLDPQIVQAVRKKKFHLWAVDTIDQGFALLTGLPAGTLRKDGSWTPGSAMAAVKSSLDVLEAVRKEDKSS